MSTQLTQENIAQSKDGETVISVGQILSAPVIFFNIIDMLTISHMMAQALSVLYGLQGAINLCN